MVGSLRHRWLQCTVSLTRRLQTAPVGSNGDIRAANIAAIIVGLNDRRVSNHGRCRVKFEWLCPPMIRLTGLPAVFKSCCQGLVTIDRDAVAITAVGIAEVAEDHDHIRACGFHRIVIVQDRIGRVLKAQTGRGGGDCDGRGFSGGHADEGDFDRVWCGTDCQDLIGSIGKIRFRPAGGGAIAGIVFTILAVT